MLQTVTIDIGQLYASKKPVIMCTLLGSCVSICLFDPVAMVSGMNHILSVTKPTIDTTGHTTRYGLQAMEQLINEMVKLGGVRTRFCAKIFGGGTLLKMSKENSPGPKNVAFARQYLKNEGIKIVAENTGGPFSRKIYFHTDTFEVLLRRNAVRSLTEHEKAFEPEGVIKVKSIVHKAGEITLFE